MSQDAFVHLWDSTLAADVVSDRPCIRSPTWAGAENLDYPEGTLPSSYMSCQECDIVCKWVEQLDKMIQGQIGEDQVLRSLTCCA